MAQAPAGYNVASHVDKTERLARKLTQPSMLESCKSLHRGQGGRAFPNVNFHKEGSPALVIVEKLDRVLLDAYGLAEEPHLQQMRTIRKDSAHILWRSESGLPDTNQRLD